MWYVIQVSTGKEAKVCELVKHAAHERCGDLERTVLRECFVPLYQFERKFHGEYRVVSRNLFPGYVIAVSSDVGKLNRLLHGVSAFTRILGSSREFVPLDRTEMAFINSFTSEKHRVVRVSRAVSEGDTITVVEGPMVGKEGWIKKINRRKGTALVETVMFGRTIQAEIGLAVVSKD